jgi:hypothetical protein
MNLATVAAVRAMYATTNPPVMNRIHICPPSIGLRRAAPPGCRSDLATLNPAATRVNDPSAITPGLSHHPTTTPRTRGAVTTVACVAYV